MLKFRDVQRLSSKDKTYSASEFITKKKVSADSNPKCELRRFWAKCAVAQTHVHASSIENDKVFF